MKDRLTTFVGGDQGRWRVIRMEKVSGAGLDPVARLDAAQGTPDGPPPGSRWLLRGVTSELRYTTQSEHEALTAASPDLERPEAICAALIPISKSLRWWGLAQDERRAILADRSSHIETGRRYLPAIARKLYHGHDLGEPFDFLTWFEYAPSDAAAFEDLVATLRDTEEWTYVVREVDIRLIRDADA